MPLPIFDQPWRRAGAGLGAYQTPMVPILAPPQIPFTPGALPPVLTPPGGGGGGGGGGGEFADDGSGGNDSDWGEGSGDPGGSEMGQPLPDWLVNAGPAALTGGLTGGIPGALLSGITNVAATRLGRTLAGFAPIKTVPTETWDAYSSGTPRVDWSPEFRRDMAEYFTPETPYEQFLRDAEQFRQWPELVQMPQLFSDPSHPSPSAPQVQSSYLQGAAPQAGPSWPIPGVATSVLDTFNAAADKSPWPSSEADGGDNWASYLNEDTGDWEDWEYDPDTETWSR